MAKNKAVDLNDILFQTIQNIVDPDTDESGKVINELTIEKAIAVSKVGQVMVNNMKMQVEAMKLVASGKIKNNQLPANVQGNFTEIEEK